MGHYIRTKLSTLGKSVVKSVFVEPRSYRISERSWAFIQVVDFLMISNREAPALANDLVEVLDFSGDRRCAASNEAVLIVVHY